MIGGQISAASKTSYYVQASNADIGLTPALAGVLARQPGVRAVTEVRTTDATVAGSAHSSVDGCRSRPDRCVHQPRCPPGQPGCPDRR
jgi:hypothetical protein